MYVRESVFPFWVENILGKASSYILAVFGGKSVYAPKKLLKMALLRSEIFLEINNNEGKNSRIFC
jgi:hypothetical protein